jgi:hypothetical protein
MPPKRIRIRKKVIGPQAIIAQAFKKVSQSADLQGKWLSCETWANLINQRSAISQVSYSARIRRPWKRGRQRDRSEDGEKRGRQREGSEDGERGITGESTIITTMAVNGGTVSRSLASDEQLKVSAEIFSGANSTGFFMVAYKHTKFYYACQAGESILRPKLTQSWYEEVMKSQSIQQNPSSEAFAGSTVMSVADTDAVPSQQKKKRRTSGGRNLPQLQLPLDVLRKQTYFDSPEAAKPFKPMKNETVLDAIDRRIELWQSVQQYFDGWKNMIIGDSDYDQCSPKSIHNLKQQAVTLVQAYGIAKEEIIARKSTWEQCCEKSVKAGKSLGMTACLSSNTLQHWHLLFVESPEGFVGDPNVELP